MARIYRQKYPVMETITLPDGTEKRVSVKGQDGKPVYKVGERWTIEYTDAQGRTRRAGGYRDKRATQEKLAGILRAVDRERAGIIDRESLDLSEHLKLPLTEHLGDYKKALLAKGVSPHHVRTVIPRIEKLLAGCGFNYWPDIQATRVQQYLFDLRQGQADTSIATSNGYLTATKAFVNWMIRERRATDNPLVHLRRGNDKVDRRHDRRALSADELARLIAAAETGSTFRALPGVDRAMLYRVAAGSGLRRSELASLTPESFSLKADPPTVTVRAAYSKHRRDDVQPIPAALADALVEYLDGRATGKPIWNIPDRTADMIRMDLRRAKAWWIRETPDRKERRERRQSSYLATVDDAGRYADFHALRHSYVSALALGGVAPRVAQSLARHSTITLTMDRYAHLSTGDAAAALDALPDLTTKRPKPDTERLRATGTFDATVDGAHSGWHSGFLRRTMPGGSMPCKGDTEDDANRGQSEASKKANKDRGFCTVKPGGSSPFSAQREKRATGFEPATFSLEG